MSNQREPLLMAQTANLTPVQGSNVLASHSPSVVSTKKRYDGINLAFNLTIGAAFLGVGLLVLMLALSLFNNIVEKSAESDTVTVTRVPTEDYALQNLNDLEYLKYQILNATQFEGSKVESYSINNSNVTADYILITPADDTAAVTAKYDPTESTLTYTFPEPLILDEQITRRG